MLRRLGSYFSTFCLLILGAAVALWLYSFNQTIECKVSFCAAPTWEYGSYQFRKNELPSNPLVFDNEKYVITTVRWSPRWDDVVTLRLSRGQVEVGGVDDEMRVARFKMRCLPASDSASSLFRNQITFKFKRELRGIREADKLVGLGFRYSNHKQLIFPGWVGVGVFLFLSFPGIKSIYINLRGRWRHRNGLCRHCGYDLRQSHNRCPECGSEKSSATSAVRRRLSYYLFDGLVAMTACGAMLFAKPGLINWMEDRKVNVPDLFYRSRFHCDQENGEATGVFIAVFDTKRKWIARIPVNVLTGLFGYYTIYAKNGCSTRYLFIVDEQLYFKKPAFRVAADCNVSNGTLCDFRGFVDSVWPMNGHTLERLVGVPKLPKNLTEIEFWTTLSTTPLDASIRHFHQVIEYPLDPW